MKKIKQIVAVIGLITLGACSGGGTSSGVTVTGSVPTANASLSKALVDPQISSACAADTIVATRSDATATSAEVAEDCSFSLTLETGESYAISLISDGSFVASMVFNSGISGFSENAFFIPNGETAFDLGSITLTGSTALCEHNPWEHFDRDDDGTPDYSDDDDDGDGVADEDEADCDYDGYLDDDSTCDDSSNTEGRIVRFKPFRGAEYVHPKRDVRVLISCEVDPDTVTSETFSVVSELDEAISCDYRLSEEGHRIECRHRDDPFAVDTSYTVTVEGVKCADGRDVSAASISFTTSSLDDDSSEDGENSLDDDSDDSSNSDDDSSDDASDDENSEDD